MMNLGNRGMKEFLGLGLILVLFILGTPQNSGATPPREPVSGTPLLEKQKRQLLQDLGKKGTLQAEKDLLNNADFVGRVVNFWAFDFGSNQYYQTPATCKKLTVLSNGSGYKLSLYVENSQLTNPVLTDAILDNVVSQFNNNILSTETTYFGAPPAGDFTIFILDIQDGGGSTFVAGYFDSLNEYSGVASSNARHMIFMDSNPGVPGTTTFYGTLAHEFQHFIHFSYDPFEETWVNEGLAGLARFVCGYGHRTSHVEAFATTPNTSLINWQDNLANYGATYLFMLYLAEHYGGSTITHNIVANAKTGISGVNSALLLTGYNVTVDDIFKNWVVANDVNNISISSGIYGYSDSFSGITYAPGNFQKTNSHSTYPATESGDVNSYAANYIQFSSLGGTYNIFVLIPYNISASSSQSYSYTGALGSFVLTLSGLNSQMGMSGIQEGTSNPTPRINTSLSSSNTIDTGSGGTTPSSGSSGGGGGGGGCFIATVAYGSPFEREVIILRDFRDRYLLKTLPGQVFVSLYYSFGPRGAEWISPYPSLKAVARTLLYPAVGLSYLALEYPGGMSFSLFIFMFLFGYSIWRRKGLNGIKQPSKA